MKREANKQKNLACSKCLGLALTAGHRLGFLHSLAKENTFGAFFCFVRYFEPATTQDSALLSLVVPGAKPSKNPMRGTLYSFLATNYPATNFIV